MSGFLQSQRSTEVDLVLEPPTKVIYLLIIIGRCSIQALTKSDTFQSLQRLRVYTRLLCVKFKGEN